MSKTIYVTYLTIYYGDLLPPYYIGSTSKINIGNGYRGSVSSKKYKETWKSELKENPHLFETIIISEHQDRKDAYKSEAKLHKNNNVSNNDYFINKTTATPMYNKKHKQSTKQIMSKKKMGKLNYKFSGYYHTPFGVFESSFDINNHTDLISQWSSLNWCKNCDKIITKHAYYASKYLRQYNISSIINKTYRDIGFWFEPIY